MTDPKPWDYEWEGPCPHGEKACYSCDECQRDHEREYADVPEWALD